MFSLAKSHLKFTGYFLAFLLFGLKAEPLSQPVPENWPHQGIISQQHYKLPDGTPIGPMPNPWTPLEVYQETITRAEFERKLHTLYDPFGGFTPYLDINDDRVVIYPSAQHHDIPQFTLRFAKPGVTPRSTPRWFRTPEEFRAEAHPTADQPLRGLRIALDPGHIGGPWAQIENRCIRYEPNGPPIQEGDLNLITAKYLTAQLRKLGAEVFPVRESTEPVTPYRPNTLMSEAREYIISHSKNPDALRAMPIDQFNSTYRAKLLENAEFIFYRASEIGERGNRIRNNFIPDLTVTLYINATPSSGRGHLVSVNQLIFFVHGSYKKSEITDPDMQRRCVYKMVEGSSDIEKEVAAHIADVFKRNTGMGPVPYGDSDTTRAVIPGNMYVVARNILANRLYDGPVVCTEPYYMNNRLTYHRILAGDYEGERVIDGKSMKSFFREYADNVIQGLIEAYSTAPAVTATNANH